MKKIFISCFSYICLALSAPGQDVHNVSIIPGAERLEEYVDILQGLSVGIVVNHASLVGSNHLVDVLMQLDVDIRKIFAPEHGFRGQEDAGAKIQDGKDVRTGLPIISLYGNNRKPTSEQLKGIDIVVFDLQDVGVRFYTYISTLHLVMEACAQAEMPILVLDRPNPNGYYIDGPIRDEGLRSFVGMHPIPIVYGMTIGELAQMINGEKWLEEGVQCDLQVIECLHYDHNMTYDLPVKPSPNLPNLRSILLYPSLCFFEGTTVSIGRGTSHQFQVIGHPLMKGGSFAFTPQSMPGATHPKHEGVRLYGTSLVGLDIETITSWRKLNLEWLIGFYKEISRGGQFFLDNNFFDKLAGTYELRKQLEEGLSEEELRASWKKDLDSFRLLRKQYLIYKDFD